MWRKSTLQHFDLGAVISSLPLPLPLPSIQPTWPALSLSGRARGGVFRSDDIKKYGKTVAFSFKLGNHKLCFCNTNHSLTMVFVVKLWLYPFRKSTWTSRVQSHVKITYEICETRDHIVHVSTFVHIWSHGFHTFIPWTFFKTMFNVFLCCFTNFTCNFNMWLNMWSSCAFFVRVINMPKKRLLHFNYNKNMVKFHKSWAIHQCIPNKTILVYK